MSQEAGPVGRHVALEVVVLLERERERESELKRCFNMEREREKVIWLLQRQHFHFQTCTLLKFMSQCRVQSSRNENVTSMESYSAHLDNSDVSLSQEQKSLNGLQPQSPAQDTHTK